MSDEKNVPYDCPLKNADRLLTQADVDQIVDVLEERLMRNFYQSMGQGLWALVKRGLVLVALALALYGVMKGYK